MQLHAYAIRGQLYTRKDLHLTSSGGRLPPSNENGDYFGPDQSCVAVDGQSVKTLFVTSRVGGGYVVKAWEEMGGRVGEGGALTLRDRGV